MVTRFRRALPVYLPETKNTQNSHTHANKPTLAYSSVHGFVQAIGLLILHL